MQQHQRIDGALVIEQDVDVRAASGERDRIEQVGVDGGKLVVDEAARHGREQGEVEERGQRRGRTFTRRVPVERAELNGAPRLDERGSPPRDGAGPGRHAERARPARPPGQEGGGGAPRRSAGSGPMILSSFSSYGRAQALGGQRKRAKVAKDGAEPAPTPVTPPADDDKK